MNVTLIGLPGAGKTAQAAILSQSNGAAFISNRNLVREAMCSHTALAQQAQEAISSGWLIPDHVLVGLLEQTLVNEAIGRDYILSGLPRSVPQAQAVHDMLSRIERPLDLAMFFDMSFDMMVDRLSVAATHIQSDIGSRLSTLKINYDNFLSATEPLLRFYDKLGKACRIDADLSAAQVSVQIAAALAAASP
ncbi:nucleoside monophosphate kinase [Agrobacterium sp. lyk4-40-TYG-31]|uniref:adenylate kinase family protein n=1 Tax=Agrobacterium sp. lyk4-40-TYG-31 TaxID=3040276 RepID=UPI00254E416A|nr:nucleoside monophosphate kinase [Agrobacterium sp. lyk4-40-TYG-31]